MFHTAFLLLSQSERIGQHVRHTRRAQTIQASLRLIAHVVPALFVNQEFAYRGGQLAVRDFIEDSQGHSHSCRRES